MTTRHCPHCQHCASVIVPTLQMLAARVAALEDGTASRAPAVPQNQIEAAERELLRAALVACGGIQSHAARHVGITARVMHYKVQKYGLRAYCRLAR